MRISTERENYSDIMPQVLVKRVLVSTAPSSENVSLEIRLLIKDNTTDADRSMRDLVLNNSNVYILLYSGAADAAKYEGGFFYPNSVGRMRNSRNLHQHLHRDLNTRLTAFGRRRRSKTKFKSLNLGSISRHNSSQSEITLSSGTAIYDFYQTIKFEDLGQVENLKVMVFTHLDVNGIIDTMEHASGVNLDFADEYLNSINAIGTDAKVTTILNRGRVPETSTVFVDGGGKIWTGRKHQMTNAEGELLYWMKGASHGSYEGEYPILNVRTVKNTKVIETRSMINRAVPYYGGTYELEQQSSSTRSDIESFNEILRTHTMRRETETRGRNVEILPPREQIQTLMHNKSAPEGEVYISIANNDDLDIFFSIEWKQLLKKHSAYFHLMPLLSPSELQQVFAETRVTRVCLKRREVYQENIAFTKFQSKSPKPIEDQSPVTVASNYPLSSQGVSNLVGVMIEYSDLTPEEASCYLSYTAKDTTVKMSNGRYQYYTEFEMFDGLGQWFQNLSLSINRAQQTLLEFIEVANRPVQTYYDEDSRTTKIDPNSNGNYIYSTGEFTEQFKNSSGARYLDLIKRAFVTMVRFVDGDREFLRAGPDSKSEVLKEQVGRMLYPVQGASLETIQQFSDSFHSVRARFDRLISSSKSKMLSRSSTSTTSPKSDIPGLIKYVNYFDKTFSTDQFSEVNINYFPESTNLSDAAAIVDIGKVVELEAETYGETVFGTNTSSGVYLTPHSVDYTIPFGMYDSIPLSLQDGFEILPGSDDDATVAYESGSPSRKDPRSKTKSYLMKSTSATLKTENLLDCVFGNAGSSKAGPAGHKDRRGRSTRRTQPWHHTDPSDVRMDVPPVAGLVYGNNEGAFSSHLERLAQDMSMTLEIDTSTSGVMEVLENLPTRISDMVGLSTLEQLEVLTKLTQNHINQLTNTKKSSLDLEDALDALSDVSLYNINPENIGLLGTLRMIAGMGANPEITDSTLIAGEVSRRLREGEPEVDLPPQLATDIIGNPGRHGVLEDGTLSKYTHGMIMEVKEVGSPSKGARSIQTQRRVNTDLSIRNQDTETNLNKISPSSLRRTGTPSGFSSGKAYRLCRLVPYENRARGVKRAEETENAAVRNEYFLVEV
jgi:hypothetical protein